MRIVFMGAAELAGPCLKSVAGLASHQVVAVISQPDRPKGRELIASPPPVKITAHELGLPIHQPLKLREPAGVALVRDLQPDLIVVVAYGQILPRSVLEIPACGCINVHTSLLPRWRGASPIQHAILHGDSETGVTTMFMDEHMDTGDIILQRAVPIQPDDTSAILHDRLAQLGAAALVETITLIDAKRAPRSKQDSARATHARKISKEDGRVDWTKPAAHIERQTRAFNPWPSAYANFGGSMLKIWKAVVVGAVPGVPGEVTDDLVVATGEGGLKIVEVQPAGGKRMSFGAFLRGHGLNRPWRFASERAEDERTRSL